MSTANDSTTGEWPEVSAWDSSWLEGTLFDLFPTLGETTGSGFPETASALGSPFWFEDLSVPHEQNNIPSNRCDSTVDVASGCPIISGQGHTNTTTGDSPAAPIDAACIGTVGSIGVCDVPPQSVEHAENQIDDENPFEGYLYEFDGGPKLETPRRKRRRFDPERREEVSQLRKVGACIRCKLTKSPVRNALS